MSTNEPRKPVDPNAVSQRYLFETCFDSDRMAGASADDTPEPTFTAEDLEKAREAAFAEGEAAGRQDAVNSIEKQLLNGLGRLVEQMGALTDDQMRFQQDLTERSVELALKATRKMFPAMAQRDGLVEIDALLTNCLLEAKEEPRIMVRVSPDLAEPYRERIDELAAAAGYQGVVTVLPDESFGPADCRVEWTNGGAERVAAHMWREFDAATQRIFCDPADDWEDDREPAADLAEPSDGATLDGATLDGATLDGATLGAAPHDPRPPVADAPDILNSHADIPAPPATDPQTGPPIEATTDLSDGPAMDPTGEAAEEAAVEAAAEPAIEPADETVPEAMDEPAADPTADPTAKPVAEPITDPPHEPAETPIPPNDATAEPGMTPDAGPPPQPATAS